MKHKVESVLREKYSRKAFIENSREILPFDTSPHIYPYLYEFDKDKYKNKVESFTVLGETEVGSKTVFLIEVKLCNTHIKRSPIFQRTVVAKFLQENDGDAAIAAFYSDDSEEWKYSLVDIEYGFDENGKTTKKIIGAKRYSFIVGPNVPVHTAVQQISLLHGKENSFKAILDAFSVENVTKEFFIKISNWFAWALKNVQFPKDAEKEKGGREITLIRFITRIIFIWFMKEKGLIPDYLFDKKEIEKVLIDLSETESTYYKAILQNLFFATLSTKIEDRRFAKDAKWFGKGKGGSEDFDNNYVYRYKELFVKQDDEYIKKLFKQIPFLNGGLFECLDKRKEKIFVDGFTRNKKYQPYFPNKLFFSSEKEEDLNDYYGTKNKKYKVEGLINILKRYNFTVDENTPVDINVALDPELLGKVFENLLASYNPETATTARKETGSYYTPREIVHFMVDESLKEYFKTKLKDISDIDKKLDELFSYDTDSHNFNENDAKRLIRLIDSIRIIDPAVGSGAFPMGILQRLVYILSKLDPNNKVWREIQKEKILKKIGKSLEEIKDKYKREEELKKLNDTFERNSSNYGRKLYLIKNCIYGVDIQPIAVQIAKLRFFISLLVDMDVDKNKDNLGIDPLPNLETKFIAANSLINLNNDGHFPFKTPGIEKLENKLKKVRSLYFYASDNKLKEKLKKQDEEIRKRLGELLKGNFNPESTQKIIEWNPYDPNRSAKWFDPEWMFGIKDGFDIVIANPPYVNIYKISHTLAEYLKKHYKSAYKKFDLYVIFIERGIQISKIGGIITYIVPDKWISQPYGQRLRNIILEECKIIELIDLTNQKIFKSATVDNFIFLFIHDNNNLTNMILYATSLNADNKTYLEQSKLHKNKPFLLNISNREQKILEKINSQSIRIRDIFYVNWGCRPSPKQLYVSDKKENDLYKPLITGRNIKKYYIKQNSKWVKYVSSMYNPMFSDLFEKTTIVMKDIIGKNNLMAALNNKKYYSDHTVINLLKWTDFKESNAKHRIYPKNRYSYYSVKFVLGIVNSILISFYFNKTMRNGLHTLPNNVKQLPIPKIPESEQKPFIDLVDKILAITQKEDYDPKADNEDNRKVKEYERQIDELVYKLYNLTSEEIKIVEKSAK